MMAILSNDEFLEQIKKELDKPSSTPELLAELAKLKLESGKEILSVSFIADESKTYREEEILETAIAKLKHGTLHVVFKENENKPVDIEYPELKIELLEEERAGGVTHIGCSIQWGEICFTEYTDGYHEVFSNQHSVTVPPRVMALFMPFIQEKLEELGHVVNCRS